MQDVQVDQSDRSDSDVIEQPECGASEIQPDVRDDATARLRRIEGQAAGLRKMIEEDRHCIDVLTQIGSVQQALKGVGRLMLKNYLKTCVTAALQEGDQPDDEDYEEFMDVIYKFVR